MIKVKELILRVRVIMKSKKYGIERLCYKVLLSSLTCSDKLQQSAQHILKVFLTLILLSKSFQLFCNS